VTTRWWWWVAPVLVVVGFHGVGLGQGATEQDDDEGREAQSHFSFSKR
jgi:hypothetical protein